MMGRVSAFVTGKILPAEDRYRQEVAADPRRTPAIMEALKAEARAAALWNMFLPDAPVGTGMAVLDYAPVAEIIGRSPIAAEVFNCSAPDTGNMEILHMFGTDEQKRRWLDPLLEGRTRSAFLMTEPAVASSDATNIATRITRDGDHYVITGRKWWSTNMAHPNLDVLIVMGKTDPRAHTYRQQSQVLVPADTAGVRVERFLSVFGYDEFPAGHAEVILDNVRVPASYLLAGEGRGFEIAQARLGPGRIHHCMRMIGAAERALELLCQRVSRRRAFGTLLADQSLWHERIAEARNAIDMARLLVLQAAWQIDRHGARAARVAVAQIKSAVPRAALGVIDDAIQAFGAGGLAEDAGLAQAYASIRSLRIADGPDEVHNRTIARAELAHYR